MTEKHYPARIVKLWITCIFVLSLLAPQLCAQIDTGTIVGTVKDQSGRVVPGARVTITNEGTNVPQTTTTGSKGSYTVPLLPPGHYTLSVQKQGFKKYSRSGITLEVNQTATVNAKLTLVLSDVNRRNCS